MDIEVEINGVPKVITEQQSHDLLERVRSARAFRSMPLDRDDLIIIEAIITICQHS